MFSNHKDSLAEICLSILELPIISIIKLNINEDKYRKLENNLNDYLESNPKFDINAKTKGGYSLIYFAAKTGNIALFNLLKDKGAKLDDTYDGQTLRDIVQQELVKIDVKDKVKPMSDNNPLRLLKEGLMEMDAALEKQQINYNKNALSNYRDMITIEEIKHTQRWIMDPMQKGGYKHKPPGYCFGISHMGAQAILLEDRDDDNELIHFNQFRARVNILRRTPNIHDELERLKHKRILLVEICKSKNPTLVNSDKDLDVAVQSKLNHLEKQILEIEPFLNGIEAFQQIEKYPNFSPYQLIQNRIGGLELVPNIELEKHGGAVTVDHFFHQGNVKELTQLLQMIEQFARENDYNYPIVLTIGANAHCICIAYDPVIAKRHHGNPAKAWIDVDANYPDDMEKVFNANEIADLTKKQIYASQSHLPQYTNPNSILELDIAILATAERALDIKQKIITPLHEPKKMSMFTRFFNEITSVDRSYEKKFLKSKKGELKLEQEHLFDKVKSYNDQKSKSSTASTIKAEVNSSKASKQEVDSNTATHRPTGYKK